MLEDNIVLLLILQSYILQCYHTYFILIEMDITEAIFCQHLLWPVIGKATWKQVSICNTFQGTKRSNKIW